MRKDGIQTGGVVRVQSSFTTTKVEHKQGNKIISQTFNYNNEASGDQVTFSSDGNTVKSQEPKKAPEAGNFYAKTNPDGTSVVYESGKNGEFTEKIYDSDNKLVSTTIKYPSGETTFWDETSGTGFIKDKAGNIITELKLENGEIVDVQPSTNLQSNEYQSAVTPEVKERIGRVYSEVKDLQYEFTEDGELNYSGTLSRSSVPSGAEDIISMVNELPIYENTESGELVKFGIEEFDEKELRREVAIKAKDLAMRQAIYNDLSKKDERTLSESEIEFMRTHEMDMAKLFEEYDNRD